MKKTIKTVALILATGAIASTMTLNFTSCNKTENIIPNQENSDVKTYDTQSYLQNGYSLPSASKNFKLGEGTDIATVAKPKFKFRWDGCERPLGMCLTIPFKIGELTTEEIQDDMGHSTISIVEGKMKMILHRQANLPNGLVPISESGSIGSEVSNIFGYNDIVILRKNYTLSYNASDAENPNYQPYFGEITVNILVK